MCRELFDVNTNLDINCTFYLINSTLITNMNGINTTSGIERKHFNQT